ncbi:indoleacetamide hydrolase [Bradyrhizobium sp. CCBAU 51753]|uniref:indoleacetamide hydrolase n=1 Tax=Bradyrhizobium sp. CCBAU 51753 TaxID=1325100 RepID=UPI00188C7250|nr:indoleacetamide hydrolase [Bradyrhizobium sp. CCBAU 51753]QOZ24694.1 indoleacetamide hydrolase [Bradyrhizobium sp. CCBAU 51753]
MANSTEATAAEIVAAIRDKRVTAVSVVQAALDRAEQLKHLNAFIVLNRDGALAAARQVDAGQRAGPLAGLPIVVKDNINTSDLPTTGGTPALQHARPARNAPSLQKLLDAGAVVIGKTNLHELAFGITSTNLAPFAGPVRNPYDITRIPGGSSGGTSAAIAARVVTCGLGSDTGGSTRVPAALTGTVGLRPSVGNGGAERRYHDDNQVVPISHTRDTVGPMGRTVADVALLDAVITGTPLAVAAPLRGVRLGIPACFWNGLDRDVEAVARAACAKLADAGVVLVDIDMPDLFEQNGKVSFVVALHEPIADIPAYLAASGIEGITLADIAAKVASPDVVGAFGAITTDAFGAAYDDAIGVQRPALQAIYAAYFRDNNVDAILFPTTIAPAPLIDETNGSSEMSVNGGEPAPTFGTMIRNTDPGSNAGLPGLSLHAGMTPDGLPVGLEIDGAVGSDARLLGLGLSIEAILGSAPPPKL